MMPSYRKKTNTIVLGLPLLKNAYLRLLELYPLKGYNFVENYIEGYWLSDWDHSEISFCGDLNLFSTEHMSSNDLEPCNNELYTLMGRHAHPNPYHFMCTLKRALATTKKIPGWVENGDFEEVKSKNARRAVEKRQRLKVQYINRLKRADSEVQERIARIKYMKATGSTSTRILAKGKKKVAKKAEKRSLKPSDTKMGRPSYKRVKAPVQKKCRFCGKVFNSKAGCTNHENTCKNRMSTNMQIKCNNCSKIYRSKKWLKTHEKKCETSKNHYKNLIDTSSVTNNSTDSDDSEKITRASLDSQGTCIKRNNENYDTDNSKNSDLDTFNSDKSIKDDSSVMENESLSNKSDSDTNESDKSLEKFNLEEQLTIIKENVSNKKILECLNNLKSNYIASESIMETDARDVLFSLTTRSGNIGSEARLILSVWKNIVRQTIEADRTMYLIVDRLSETMDQKTLESLLIELLPLPVSTSTIVNSGVGKVMKVLRQQSGQVGLLANQIYSKWTDHIRNLPAGHMPRRTRPGS